MPNEREQIVLTICTLLESGLTKLKADELARFTTASVEGGINSSRTYHTADPLRVVIKHLKVLLA